MSDNNDALREMRVNKSAPARAKLCETCKHKDIAENAHPCRLCWNPMGDMYEPVALAASKPEPQATTYDNPPAEINARLQMWLTLGKELHPNTSNLVVRFARALASKLADAEKKYGYSDGWRDSGWMDECRSKLMEHIAKGDPRDVAAYCAFLWHHGESTVQPEPQAQAGEREFESGKDVQIRRLESALASKEDEFQRLHAHCLSYKEAIAKKDAALKACVEALEHSGKDDFWRDKDAAIQQAKEALK